MSKSMKGVSNIVWIIITLLIALIVLIVIIPLVSRAQTAAGVTVSETDWLNCCSNYCGAGQNIGATNCRAGKNTVGLGDLCTALGKDTAACPPTNHPLCSCKT